MHAEAILAAARRPGRATKKRRALTDLGTIQLNEGDPQGAIRSLEQALAIAREIGDTAAKVTSLGNLGMAMLAVRQPGSTREYVHARAGSRPRRDGSLRREVRPGTAGNRRVEPARLQWLAASCLNDALSLTRRLGDRHQEANLLWHLGIQYAELGQREPAIARAEEAVAIFKSLGRPQAASYGAYLQKYRMGLVDESPATGSVESIAAGLPGWFDGRQRDGEAKPTAETRPTKGDGRSRACSAWPCRPPRPWRASPARVSRPRRSIFSDGDCRHCAGCEHHTGVRCKVCGCFTNVKSRLLHENCPIGKWPA